MPIYDFRCLNCSHEFESLISPWEPYQCIKCRALDVEKKVSLPANHAWKCSNEGAGARVDTQELKRREEKRERVDNLYKKLSD